VHGSEGVQRRTKIRGEMENFFSNISAQPELLEVFLFLRKDR